MLAKGAIFENESGTHTCHKDITTKEAIEYVLKCFAILLQNTSIHLKTDNFATSVITRKGSSSIVIEGMSTLFIIFPFLSVY